MKAPIVTGSLTAVLLITAASAQDGPPPATSPTAPASASRPLTKTDVSVAPANTVLPGLTPPDQLKAATLALPNEPIEPWLLTKEAGPFMVIAKTFRGPEAERFALALAKELRRDYNLPAYIMRTKDFPMRSNIRNVPPTAPNFLRKAQLTEPEKTRTYDEAAVLVGDEKTLAASEALWHRVKKIKPKCLDQMPSILPWRHGVGLSTAIRTTNPYVPAQKIFPGRGVRDPLIARMNSGPRSVFNCPARYSLTVADFTGRSTVSFNNNKDEKGLADIFTKSRSPLETAHEDAEHLAELLAKDPDVRKTGFQPYVYHDLTSSKVLIGSFSSANDPAAVELRETLLKIAGKLSARNSTIVMAPGTMLTDLEDETRPIIVR